MATTIVSGEIVAKPGSDRPTGWGARLAPNAVERAKEAAAKLRRRRILENEATLRSETIVKNAAKGLWRKHARILARGTAGGIGSSVFAAMNLPAITVPMSSLIAAAVPTVSPAAFMTAVSCGPIVGAAVVGTVAYRAALLWCPKWFPTEEDEPVPLLQLEGSDTEPDE